MPKYTEAFFNITHKPVTIMQIRNEYNLDHTVYERRYKGHIFCPYCKAVPLTVVHTNGLLYYRGHPHEEHGEGCMYTLKEIVSIGFGRCFFIWKRKTDRCGGDGEA